MCLFVEFSCWKNVSEENTYLIYSWLKFDKGGGRYSF